MRMQIGFVSLLLHVAYTCPNDWNDWSQHIVCWIRGKLHHVCAARTAAVPSRPDTRPTPPPCILTCHPNRTALESRKRKLKKPISLVSSLRYCMFWRSGILDLFTEFARIIRGASYWTPVLEYLHRLLYAVIRVLSKDKTRRRMAPERRAQLHGRVGTLQPHYSPVPVLPAMQRDLSINFTAVLEHSVVERVVRPSPSFPPPSSSCVPSVPSFAAAAPLLALVGRPSLLLFF